MKAIDKQLLGKYIFEPCRICNIKPKIYTDDIPYDGKVTFCDSLLIVMCPTCGKSFKTTIDCLHNDFDTPENGIKHLMKLWNADNK